MFLKNKITFLLCLLSLIIQNAYTQDLNPYLKYAKNKIAHEEYSEAIQILNQAIQINSNDDSAYFYRGYIYYKVENYTEAIADFSKLIEKNSLSPLLFFYRGDSYRLTRNLSKALVDIQKTILLNPTAPENFHLRALIYFGQNKILEGLQDINYAIKLNPKNEKYFLTRSKFHFYIKDFEKCLQDLTIAIKLNPHDAEAWADKALLHFTIHDTENALADCQEAILKKPLYAKTYALQALILWQQKSYTLAQEAIEKYTELAYTGEDYHYIAQKSHELIADKNMLQKAEKWALLAVQLEDIYEHNHTYAEILYKLGKTLNALEVANKSISLAKKETLAYEKTQHLINLIKQTDIDDIPPVITLVSPAVSRGVIVVKAEGELQIIGKAADESGIKAVYVNGNPAKISENGDFDGLLLLSPSEDKLTIKAIDIKGNIQEEIFTLKKTLLENTTQGKLAVKSYALIFATDEYDYWNNLKNPVADAEAITKDLQEMYGFQTDLVINPTKNQIILKLKEYVQKKYQADDQLLIFFAGHGQFDELFKEGYLVARDSKLDDEIKSTYIPYTTLRTYINGIDSKHIFLVMDVCFGGTFDPSIANRGKKLNEKLALDFKEEFIKRKMKFRTRKYLTSGGKEYVPDGRPGHHSPFVRQWLEALRTYGGEDGILTLAEILSYVELTSPAPQVGEFGNNEPGSDFIFIAK